MWVAVAVAFFVTLPVYFLWSFLIVAVEKSDRHLTAAAVTVCVALVWNCTLGLLGRRQFRPVERWAAGQQVDRALALEATYTYGRRTAPRMLSTNAALWGLLSVILGMIAGADPPRLIQYWALGTLMGIALSLVAMHSLTEALVRPARVAIAGDTAIGDHLPRSRPTFATWSGVLLLAAVFNFTVCGAMLAAVFDEARDQPILFAAIGAAMTVTIGVPLTVGAVFAQSMRPIRDLALGTERVATGDYTRRLPVVQDDDLGALAASFNRMQAGLAERERLQAAFGTYVDPALAARLLEQGDDVFTGERRDVSVMFIDIRDFTPYAEANTAEDTVTRLNALFAIVVPAVVEAGGHINKFLGDGALAVFGAPNDLAGHADAAVSTAQLIHRLVAQRFGDDLKIGIGINTGTVIAGTIGGGGKLEFTLIGDTVNVAARVEQLTKATNDPILLTDTTLDALTTRPAGLTDRGRHALKGKSAPITVFGLKGGSPHIQAAKTITKVSQTPQR